MADTRNLDRSQAATRRVAREVEEKERELLCKLPHGTHPAEERGERIDTAKAIATGGKHGADACELPDRRSRQKPSRRP
jgi:hypothetical protein